MSKRNKLIVESIVTVLLTLGIFTIFTLFHLVHSLSFIFPVFLAILIYRYRGFHGIAPSIVLLIAAPIITYYLPVGEGSYLRGLLVMTASVTIAYLHAECGKHHMPHGKEILLLMGVELLFAVIMTIVFHIVNDPRYDIFLEFQHYFHDILHAFHIDEHSLYGQNLGKIFIYGVGPYTIIMDIFQVLMTHILLHISLKYIYKLTHHHVFSGLYFKLPKWTSVAYFVTFILLIISLVFLGHTLPNFVLILMGINMSFHLVIMIIFMLKAGIYFTLLLRSKTHREWSLLVFVLIILFSFFTAIFGALSNFFEWDRQLKLSEDEQEL